jgi:CBS domain-containing protein
MWLKGEPHAHYAGALAGRAPPALGSPLHEEISMKKPIAKLTAADVMEQHIITVEASDTLKDALDLMTEHHVSGLPVIDADNRCLGVISASDILGYEQEHLTQSGEEGLETAPYYNPDIAEWEDVPVSAFALEMRGGTPVEAIMTTEVISVSPDAKISHVAATMVENEVHRVLVLDDDRSLLGLISAVDFVRLVAEGGD